MSQSRKGMPDGVGGVTWLTPDDASTSGFTPLYCGITALPAPYLKGDYKKFEWDSAWWVSNLVSNLCYVRWSRIAPDVQEAQSILEADLLKMQPVIEEAAVKLASTDPTLMCNFLTHPHCFNRRRRSSVTGTGWPSQFWSSTSTATSRSALSGSA